ncbi:MAG TPA: hypothetical protein VHI71_03555 [Actinomycetota bacterium]|nr:hypothetical protein [Actinomycetota bacterium]
MKKRLAVAVLALVALGACGGDDDEPAATATPAATTAPPATPTPAPSTPSASTPPATTEPYAGPIAGKATPQEAAQSFFADWGELDRASASGYATQAAIDEAFAQQPPQAQFMDCFEEGNHFLCGYYYEGGALNIVVVDSDAYGWIVTDVFYVAD